MQKIILLIAIFIFCLYESIARENYYISFGGNLINPTGYFKTSNKQSIGYTLQLETRRYCHIWYGVRVDYIVLKRAESLLIGENYFKRFLLLSPEIRYVFNNGQDYKNQFMPYLTLLLHLSSITSVKNDKPLGFGGAAGAGMVYCFNLFKTCISLDLTGLYNSPNLILKSDERNTLNGFLVSITLGVEL